MAFVSSEKPRGFRTPRCPVCSLPLQQCICSHFAPLNSQTDIILLRHPNEAKRASGTGFLALQCFTNARLWTPEQVESELLNLDPAADRVDLSAIPCVPSAPLGAGPRLKPYSKPLALLFPPDGEELPQTDEHHGPKIMDAVHPLTLIVPDGSWGEARRMVRKNIALRQLPRVSPQFSEHRWIHNPLRQDKWNRPCTAEAIGLWLTEQGDNEAANHLRHCLDAFVAAHRRCRGKT